MILFFLPENTGIIISYFDPFAFNFLPA